MEVSGQTFTSLVEAIENKQVVTFEYGEKKDKRRVEPFALGLNNEPILRAYDQEKKDWRLFKLADIKNLKLEAAKFIGYRAGYNKFGDKSMQSVLKQV